MKRKLRIVLTPGDPEGIGPEVTWKTLKRARVPSGVEILCIGARAGFLPLRSKVTLADESALLKGSGAPRSAPPQVWLLPAPEEVPAGRHLAGYQCGWAIERAVQLIRDGMADALVTGPISKERLQAGGFPFNGHTDFLAKLGGVPSVTMMLANPTLRVSLVTTHLPLAKVAERLNAAEFRRAVLHTYEHLARDLAIRKPRIAVAALNPHAGENGLLGREELEVLSPEIVRLRGELGTRCVLTDPLPADTLFMKHLSSTRNQRYDAVVCMYHDQGLIPVKLLDFPHTVNVSLGLPFIRTSVDHGVGFDIAGKGKADPSSMEAAVHLALRLSRIRLQTRQ